MRTYNVMLIGALLLAVQAAYSNSVSADALFCKEYSAAKNKLSAIDHEYSALAKIPANAENMVVLYQRLEQAAVEAQALYPKDYGSTSGQYMVISDCLWDTNFSELGLEIGHYSDRLEYTDKLLAEAHRLNPHTKYRSYTFFTEIYGKRGTASDDDFPNIDKAQLYLTEFPDGPYATKAKAVLAGFYHDLYAALRAIAKEPDPEKRGVTYDCFNDYIAKHPKEANQEQARKLGIAYFEKVLSATAPDDVKRPMYLSELNALKQGETDNVDNVCGD